MRLAFSIPTVISMGAGSANAVAAVAVNIPPDNAMARNVVLLLTIHAPRLTNSLWNSVGLKRRQRQPTPARIKIKIIFLLNSITISFKLARLV